MIDETRPALDARVTQLFATFHGRGEPQQSDEHVAQAVSARLGRAVDSEQITALRSSADANEADPQLLVALAEHFQVPATYLLGDDGAVVTIDRELRLLAAARDAGVRRLELRGTEISVEELIAQLQRLADGEPPSSGDEPEDRPDAPIH
ncbi:hypothetical protein [Nocardia camponoti]|uniref:Uncharacterized protein n=1 Tax=Nocardia camponoti TaxID=1616106 RepID=A0A917QUG2_9NOCA|nr:hypothetical protein [Nocardia camponoti]GGK68658.1 hypothetical protein GCM10011591_45970 [Nocardia camponoti]